MLVDLRPVIHAEDLRKEVNLQYGCDIEDIAALLFPGDYQNDCYKNFYYAELEDRNPWSWEDEDTVTLINLVKTYLQDILPDQDDVLIDVSW